MLEVVLEGVDKVVKGVINLQTVLLSKPHFVFLWCKYVSLSVCLRFLQAQNHVINPVRQKMEDVAFAYSPWDSVYF